MSRFDMRGCSRDPLSHEPKPETVAMASSMYCAKPHPLAAWIDKWCLQLLVLAFIALLVTHFVTFEPSAKVPPTEVTR